MKSYNKIYFLLFFLFIGIKTMSQHLNQEDLKSHTSKIVIRLKSELNLNGEQEKSIQLIEEKFFNELLLPDKDSAQIEIRKIKISQLKKQKEEAYKAILSTEQWVIYNRKMEMQSLKYLHERQERKRKKIQEARIN